MRDGDELDDCLKFVEFLPVYSLEAITTSFGKEVAVEELGWMKTNQPIKLNKDMFIIQVVGKAMEPTISDESWCVFRFNPIGSRVGKIVLVASNLVLDPETMQKFTLRRYYSEKVFIEDSFRHTKIVLKPDNKKFKDIVLKPNNKEFKDIILEDVGYEDFRVVAEFVGKVKKEKERIKEMDSSRFGRFFFQTACVLFIFAVSAFFSTISDGFLIAICIGVLVFAMIIKR